MALDSNQIADHFVQWVNQKYVLLLSDVVVDSIDSLLLPLPVYLAHFNAPPNQ